MSDFEGKNWYVARSQFRHEKKVFDQILSHGVEAFLPVKEEIRQWHDRKKKVQVILTPCILFIYTDKKTLLALSNEYGLKLSFMLDRMDPRKGLLVVPERQMKDFIDFVGVADDTFRLEEEYFYSKGDKIIVTSGPMKGMTGELLDVDREKRILVRLDGVLVCSMQMSSDMFERI